MAYICLKVSKNFYSETQLFNTDISNFRQTLTEINTNVKMKCTLVQAGTEVLYRPYGP